MKKRSVILILFAWGLAFSACSKSPEENEYSDATQVGEFFIGSLEEGAIFRSQQGFPMKEIRAMSKEQITWGPGKQLDEQGRPLACVELQEQYGPYGAHFLLPDQEKICLTFDEGYENGYTARILDTLKEKGVRAVFFITMDYAEAEPELVRRMIEEGHQVGNHSTNHPNMTTLRIDTVAYEVMSLHKYVEDQFGYTMTLFRAPEGAISEQSMAVIQSLGYENVLWSFAYQDWSEQHQMAPEKALQKVVGGCHPGAIYLLHAVSRTNAEILGDFIDEVEAQGYRFIGI